ncbi:MAG TPA: hypothetical protein VIG47_16845 [Gemmatimonadaceae bacterium]|jgi:hypothetical protein
MHRLLAASDRLNRMLDAGTLQEFIGELKTVSENANDASQLMGAVEALRTAARAIENCQLGNGEE